jgi:hypothetical protein
MKVPSAKMKPRFHNLWLQAERNCQLIFELMVNKLKNKKRDKKQVL